MRFHGPGGDSPSGLFFQVRTLLVSRLRSLVAFGSRCIPPGGVAPSSNMANILSRRALPAGRIATLDANKISETKH
jgi:hypothetical protein